jgi:hypothetical protein
LSQSCAPSAALDHCIQNADNDSNRAQAIGSAAQFNATHEIS